MLDARPRCREFASTIQAIFEEGLQVSQDSRHFIVSTISISDMRELETLLTDPSHCESDSLIELIYFPDESIQIRLEDRLESEAFQPKDEQAILEHLLSCRGNTLLHFEGLPTILTIHTPAHGARAFLARLNISRHLDPELSGVIDQLAGKQQGRKYKVWLRNLMMEPGEREIAFLKELFFRMAAGNDRFHEYLYFSLRFLESSRHEKDLFQSLTQHKQRCLKHLQQNKRFEAYRRDHNIETLMAQGIRIPHTDIQALRLQVALVDDICLALSGKSM